MCDTAYRSGVRGEYRRIEVRRDVNKIRKDLSVEVRDNGATCQHAKLDTRFFIVRAE